jgi:hypothetical protein
MNKKQLAHFEKRLLEERARAIKEIGHYDESFTATLQAADGDLSSYSFHMADQGTDAMPLRDAGQVRQVRELRPGHRLRAPRRAPARAAVHQLQGEGGEWQAAAGLSCAASPVWSGPSCSSTS